MRRPKDGDALAGRRHRVRRVDPRTASFLLDHKGEALLALGRAGEAAALHERAAAILDASELDAERPDVARTLHHWGLALAALGEKAAARAKLERALSIRREKLGAAHPHTAATEAALSRL